MLMNKVYVPPILTIDGVIFQLIDNKLSVLLIKRSREPFMGEWALPGGYNPQGETTTEALKRIIKAKAGVNTDDLGLIEQLYTFDAVARDPRGHAVSVVYMGLGRNIEPEKSKTTEEPAFFPITELPKVAYDHTEIIKYAHERLKAKIGYTSAVYALLPRHFTLTQLQSAYEAVLCHEVDKRNFRKKFLSLDVLEDTKETIREGAHRPAALYRFKSSGLQNLSRDFDWS
jgi:8-oxo-dGTP diphosphatase